MSFRRNLLEHGTTAQQSKITDVKMKSTSTIVLVSIFLLVLQAQESEAYGASIKLGKVKNGEFPKKVTIQSNFDNIVT